MDSRVVALLALAALNPLAGQRVPTSPWSWGLEFGAGGTPGGAGYSFAFTAGRDLARHLAVRGAVLLGPLERGYDTGPCQPSPAPCTAAPPWVESALSIATGLEVSEIRNDQGFFGGGGVALHTVQYQEYVGLRAGWFWNLGVGFAVGVSALTFELRGHQLFSDSGNQQRLGSIRIGLRVRQ